MVSCIFETHAVIEFDLLRFLRHLTQIAASAMIVTKTAVAVIEIERRTQTVRRTERRSATAMATVIVRNLAQTATRSAAIEVLCRLLVSLQCRCVVVGVVLVFMH